MAYNPLDDKAGQLHRKVQITRRYFLTFMGAFAAIGALILGGFQSLKFPNSTLEPPLLFTLTGLDPATITVDNPYMDYGHRVGIILDDKGFYCVQLICTHLGCTPNYYSNCVAGTPVSSQTASDHGFRTPAEQIPNGWICPCHGSRYFIDSTNFYGPAPRPMDWVSLAFSPDGEFIVDRSTLVVMRLPGDTTAPKWRLDPVTKKSNGLTLGV